MRYRLMPSFIAAGHQAAITAFPIAARCDLMWPEHSESRRNDQYVHLNDTLVAPVWNTSSNVTTREVWIPPGVWHDAWTGKVTTGPATMSISQPYERIPMWHRQGGLVVTTDTPGTRVDEQDWNTLVLETWPDTNTAAEEVSSVTTVRHVYALGTAAHTTISMRSSSGGKVRIDVGKADDGTARAWSLRLHLLPGKKVATAVVDGMQVDLSVGSAHIEPLDRAHAATYFPFGGTGTNPPPLAGAVAELHLPSSSSSRFVEVQVL